MPGCLPARSSRVDGLLSIFMALMMHFSISVTMDGYLNSLLGVVSCSVSCVVLLSGFLGLVGVLGSRSSR